MILVTTNSEVFMILIIHSQAIKGTVSRDFRPSVFSSINPPRALIHRLKPFRIWLRICGEIRFRNRQNRFPRCQWDCWIPSTASLRPPNLLTWSHWGRRSQTFFRCSFVLKTTDTFLCKNNVVLLKGFRSLIETGEAASAFSLKPPKPLSGSHWNRGIRFRGLIETAEVASAVSLRQLKPTISNDYLEFLSNFEAICETALARESGPLVDLWKNRGSKISWHCPFKHIIYIIT
jgi:hypothetical protein